MTKVAQLVQVYTKLPTIFENSYWLLCTPALTRWNVKHSTQWMGEPTDHRACGFLVVGPLMSFGLLRFQETFIKEKLWILVNMATSSNQFSPPYGMGGTWNDKKSYIIHNVIHSTQWMGELTDHRRAVFSWSILLVH